MRFLWRHRVAFLITAAVLAGCVLALPPILGAALRGRAEEGIREAANAPARLGSLSIHLLPPGVTLSKLEIGDPDPAAGNQPLLRADSVRVGVSAGTVFGGAPRLTFLSVSGLALSVPVDGNGESGLSRFLQGMPATRKTELPIETLVLTDLHLATYVDHRLTRFGPPAGDPDGTLDVRLVRVRNLVVPPPGAWLGREAWIHAVVEDAVCSAPASDPTPAPAGSVPDGARVEWIAVELAQAAAAGAPVRVKSIEVQGLECASVYAQKSRPPALDRAIGALILGLGPLEPEGPGRGADRSVQPGAAGLLIESLALRRGRYEVRGPDASGRPAFWRLTDLVADGQALAFGAAVATPVPGRLRVASPSESSSGPGQLLLELTDLAGGYPQSSFDVHYRAEGIAGPPFTLVSQDADGPGIAAGWIDVAFDGTCRQGRLAVDGSLTLSPDFAVDSTMAQLLASIERGRPIEPIRVRGTLDSPEASWPGSVSEVFRRAMGAIVVRGAIGGLKTTGAIVRSAIGRGASAAGQAAKSAGGAVDSLLKGIFGGD
ncbi:MAG TPA: hypothetical protein PK280_11045 [Planctomycetota bacterium]|nr:hypothetical protein [Planctomycetota bacterium]